MLRKISFVLLLIVPQIMFAQREDKAKVRKYISSLFAKVDKKQLVNVIPFVIGEKTGFVDAKTLKTILKPTDKISEVSPFNPNMTGKYGNDYTFRIDENGYVYLQKIIPREDRMGVMEMPGNSGDKIELISAKTGYKGFKVDENGKLVAYSDMYKAQHVDEFNVQPFLHKGNYFAIVTKKIEPDEFYKAVIDTIGNTLPHLNFEHHEIQKVNFLSNGEDVWFSTAVRDFKGSLISFNGNVKLKDELVGSLYNDMFNYNLNYNLSRSATGILDLNNLTWVIKPQSKYIINKITYASSTYVDTNSASDRNKVKVLLEVTEGNKTYFIDLNQKKYLPKM